jgi:hypothetical protein
MNKMNIRRLLTIVAMTAAIAVGTGMFTQHVNAAVFNVHCTPDGSGACTTTKITTSSPQSQTNPNAAQNDHAHEKFGK